MNKGIVVDGRGQSAAVSMSCKSSCQCVMCKSSCKVCHGGAPCHTPGKRSESTAANLYRRAKSA